MPLTKSREHKRSGLKTMKVLLRPWILHVKKVLTHLCVLLMTELQTFASTSGPILPNTIITRFSRVCRMLINMLMQSLKLGITGTLKQYVPGNFFGSLFKGGMAYLSKDYLSIMELLVDSEMKMFKGIDTPVIFLQNVLTDMLLGLGMIDVLKAFHSYVEKKYNAEAGFITMNMPLLLQKLEEVKVANPIICSSINIAGFRMSGGKDLYEKILRTKKLRAIAMQVLAGGAVNPKAAIEYVCGLPNIESILFGASSRSNIAQTISYIHEFDISYAIKE